MEHRVTTLRDAWTVLWAIGLAVTGMAQATGAEAQEPWAATASDAEVAVGDPDLAPYDYGFASNMDFVSAEEFVCEPSAGACDYSRCTTSNYWCAHNNYNDVYAAVEIPAGALITGMRALFYDNSGALWLSARLQSAYASAGVNGFTQIAACTSGATPGQGDCYVDINPGVTVERRYWVLGQWGYRSYYLYVSLPPTSLVRLRGVAIFWHRQLSPAPASATFGDVPTGHWAFDYIEALAASGITAGCGGGSFCPEATLTRAEMAVFLAKALGLHFPY